ncbi:preprotein translocase subunit SecE [Candidatus Gracilibacteria bacterium]|nr:preprotein translocase subunit SecE [Candidatus Gracilibacteria bacterium]
MASNKLMQYFRDSFHELTKVTWPTRNRAINICILVVAFVFVAAVVFASIDYLFNLGMRQVIDYAATNNPAPIVDAVDASATATPITIPTPQQ